MSAKTSNETQLHIDWTRCDGHGTCADLLPDLVVRDDWGFPMLKAGKSIRGKMRERADLAVDVCPMLALRVIDVPRGS